MKTINTVALAHAGAGAKISRAVLLKEANEAVSTALAKMAELMSGDLPLPALAGAFYLMHHEWSPVLARLEKAGNTALKASVVESGAPTVSDSGGYVYTTEMDFGGGKFRLVATEARAKDPDVKELCSSAGLKETQLTDEVISRVFSQDKLDKLKMAGRVTQTQIDQARKVKSTSLRVEKI